MRTLRRRVRRLLRRLLGLPQRRRLRPLRSVELEAPRPVDDVVGHFEIAPGAWLRVERDANGRVRRHVDLDEYQGA